MFKTKVYFIINIEDLKCSYICSGIASQLARFIYKMALFDGVALIIGFEIVSYSVDVLQFDLQYALLWK